MNNNEALIEGTIVRVTGESGTFKITKVYPNGDIGVWGGSGGHLPAKFISGQASFRTFTADRVKVAKLSKKVRTQLAALDNRVGA